MKEAPVYQSEKYDPALVTGRYVRVHGTKKGGYIFRVFESGSGTGRFAGRPGMGRTLREYDCDGSAIPDAVRDEAVRTKLTTKWPL